MEEERPENESDRLWQEYSRVFDEWDEGTLARWMAQTLGQFEGRVWRYSHPLMGAYRIAAAQGHDRGTWLKRLANAPAAYTEAQCCRAPLLPLVTRDVMETGLICVHCGQTAVAFEDIRADLRERLEKWANEYAPVHHVAHWDEREQASVANYDKAYEAAATQAEVLLAQAAVKILPGFLDDYPAIVWEDQDECLEVLPQDIEL
ncbi:MAG TPA: hypothetical protein VM680_01395 [Verrucomicrobiae bacterium]|nr:hypothetical protein [Verrucomicrobiae bacterium]